MKEIKTKIIQILDQFLVEEYGNKLSQFAILSLKSMIKDELNKIPDEDELNKKPDKKENKEV